MTGVASDRGVTLEEIAHLDHQPCCDHLDIDGVPSCRQSAEWAVQLAAAPCGCNPGTTGLWCGDCLAGYVQCWAVLCPHCRAEWNPLADILKVERLGEPMAEIQKALEE